MNTHTPGPWFQLPSNKIVIESPSGNIALCNLARNSESDARLIASAPELLDELTKQLAWLRHIRPQIQTHASVLMGFDQSFKCLATAIAKATG